MRKFTQYVSESEKINIGSFFEDFFDDVSDNLKNDWKVDYTYEKMSFGVGHLSEAYLIGLYPSIFELDMKIEDFRSVFSDIISLAGFVDRIKSHYSIPDDSVRVVYEIYNNEPDAEHSPSILIYLDKKYIH